MKQIKCQHCTMYVPENEYKHHVIINHDYKHSMKIMNLWDIIIQFFKDWFKKHKPHPKPKPKKIKHVDFVIV